MYDKEYDESELHHTSHDSHKMGRLCDVNTEFNFGYLITGMNEIWAHKYCSLDSFPPEV
jgi:hypothetical protein